MYTSGLAGHSKKFGLRALGEGSQESFASYVGGCV